MADIDVDVLTSARNLRTEADELLTAGGLLGLVESFGEVRLGGSAALDLMSRREIDLYLRLDDERDTARFFSVGAAIQAAYSVVKASYSNHFIRGLPGFSSGLFWGIQLDYADRRWKIDLWGEGPTAFAEHRRTFEDLREALGSVDPEVVLNLKRSFREGDGYRAGVTGLAIYQAALAGVRSEADFWEWRRSGFG